MKLAYNAYERSGRQVADVIEAPNVAQAIDDLRRRGLFVANIQEATGQGQALAPRASARPAAARAHKLGSAGKRLKNLSMFTRQLYVLTASGTPLVEALAALERQFRSQGWQAVVHQVRRGVEGGQSLAQAMQERPDAFDAVYCSLIEAGEASGRLPAMLQRLGTLVQRKLHARNLIVGAMVYPILLLAIAGGVMIALITFVIPRFGELFKTLDVPLPASTKALIDLSAFLRGQWYVVLGVAAAGGTALFSYLRSPGGRRTVDAIVLGLPQLGRIIRSFITARITRLMGVLLESKVPILDALALARQVAGNSRYVDLLRQAEDSVTRGQGMSPPFVTSDLVNPSVSQAIRNGEQAGQLGPLLSEISTFLDEDNEIVLRSLTSILEPAILVLLGLVVGGMAVSLFTPLFDIATVMQGGG